MAESDLPLFYTLAFLLQLFVCGLVYAFNVEKQSNVLGTLILHLHTNVLMTMTISAGISGLYK